MEPRKTTRELNIEMRESGIVPASVRGLYRAMPRALSLRASRAEQSRFGATLAGGGDMLLVGSRLEHTLPFATLFRVTAEGVVRERVLRGAQDHAGPSLATDGARVAVGQPAPEGGVGFVSIYRRTEGQLELEATLGLQPGEAACARFGETLAIQRDLLVLGQPGSVCVYRHSVVGWLSAGTLKPQLPYEWNPRFGTSFGVVSGRVLVGNPVEIDGHRAGPGRVFVYRQQGDQMELESELLGDGIEGGREQEPRLGFGAHIHVAGDFVLVAAPTELSPTGSPRSRVYVHRLQGNELARVAVLDVASCRSVCMIGERLFVLGDELQVFARQGNKFSAHARYPVNGASADQVTMSSCGPLLALGYPQGREDGDPDEVDLHFAEQL